MAASEAQSVIELADEAATEAIAGDLALALAKGDVVGLSGGLGAGKTTFARALIRAFVGNSSLEVPSPTFTLVQTYAEGRLPIAHFDFYRLSSADELDEIGFDDALAEGVVIVEWPERALVRLPKERLDLIFEIVGTGRRLRIGGEGRLPVRFKRSRAVRAFHDKAGWRGAERRFLQGDASTRTYERIRDGARRAVLMDWPPAAVGLPGGGSRSAYRATDVRPFIAVAAALRDAGLSAPELYASDTGAGLLLMEDLGSEGVVAAGAPIPERYRVAIAMLAEIHNRSRPAELPLPGRSVHRLPAYRSEMLADELELFLDWYFPFVIGEPAGPSVRDEFRALWAPLLSELDRAETSWVLLDVHSPNLIWLPDRDGVRRVGLLDFQDAMIGPTAYDVASLAEDARVTVPPDLERDLVAHYVELRRRADTGFDAQIFGRAYAILAAQRAMRILGVFVRLAKSAGKPSYLNHIPRVREYLARSLREPVLSGLSVWYEKRRLP